MRHWTRSALLRYKISDFFSILLGGSGDPSIRRVLAFSCGCGARRDHDAEPGPVFQFAFRAQSTKSMMLKTMVFAGAFARLLAPSLICQM
jgi:hypothetical protein